MNELWIPEGLVILFLAMPLLRSFIKALRSLEGLAWLPLIALGLLVGIIPAYGFHPECIPIMVFAFFYSIANLIRPVSGAANHAINFLYASNRRKLLAFFGLILLVLVSLPMFVFFPKIS